MEVNALLVEPKGRYMESEYTAVKVAKAVKTLRDRVAKDKIARDVFHVMSIRERARNVITLGGLQQRMKKEGYNHEMSDYVDVLKLLSTLEFGTLMTDNRGKVTGLCDIKITLQSIGAAATGQSDDLVGWKPRNKYVPINTVAEVTQTRENSRTRASSPSAEDVSLTIVINGKPVSFSIPNDLNEKEIAQLIVTLRQVNR